MRASLRYYARTHLAVGAAVAVATAVLVGALLVGDAMRAGLRQQALARLGALDLAVVSESFFPADLAARVAAELPAGDGAAARVAPVILLQGTAHHPESGQRATGIGISGIDADFAAAFGAAELAPAAGVRTVFPPVWLNAELAAELAAVPGDDVVLGIPRWSEIPGASLLAKRDAEDLVRTLRVTVAEVLPPGGIGGFALAPGSRPVRQALLRRSDLARALGRPTEVNAMVVSEPAGSAGGEPAAADRLSPSPAPSLPPSPAPATLAAGAAAARPHDGVAGIESALATALRVGDLGLRVRPLVAGDAAGRGVVELGSRSFLLPPAVVVATEAWAAERGLAVQPSFAYLANRIAVADAGGPAVPYSSVLAIDPARLVPGAELLAADGAPLPGLADDEIWLSPWTARELGLASAATSNQTAAIAAADRSGASPAGAVTPPTGALVGGARIVLDAFVVGPGDQLVEQSATLRFAGVVAFTGVAADRTLLPDVPGISDARSLRDWQAPFPFDLARIRPQDEAYWQAWGPTPKAFVSLATGARLWGSRHGTVTSLRLAGQGVDPTPGAQPGPESGRELARGPGQASGGDPGPEPGPDLGSELGRAVMARTTPAAFGMRVLPVRAEAVTAAAGSSDFAGLFVAFSFFVLISALLLVALLFSLGVESRAREAGTLLALGWTKRAVRRRFLAEGLVVAGLGALAGVPLGLGYAAGLLWALGTLWREAIGGVRLTLVVAPASLAIGATVALLAAGVAIALRLRALTQASPRRLLAGELARELSAELPRELPRELPPELPMPGASAAAAGEVGWLRRSGGGDPARGSDGSENRAGSAPGRRAGWVAAIGSVLAAGLTALAVTSPGAASAGPAFGAGTCLLVAGLAALARWCARRDPARGGVVDTGRPAASLAGLAVAGTARFPGRTRLATALVAVAVFVLGVVAASRHGVDSETGRDGGLGGFDLAATADVPLLRDLASRADQELLGLDDATLDGLGGVTVMPFALVPGDDASCLNLYRPQRPRLLGAPPAFVARGGFRFAGAVEPIDNPWELLERDLGPGVIPVIGDASSVQWILHKGLGQDVEMLDERGQAIRLRIVATLSRSFFQSELLLAEEALRRHFPSRGGSSLFLFDLPEGAAADLGRGLEDGLAPYGFDVTPAADRLAAFLAVEGTYMTAFGGLGGLGLLLGTIGLAVLLLRGAAERRSELGALAAFGFTRRRLRRLLVGESLVLLGFGTGLGLAAALLAVLPNLLQHGGGAPWAGLLMTVGAVWLVGLATNTWAASRALGGSLLAAMRGE